MKTITFLITFISIQTFASFESDMNKWIDSSLIANDIEWETAKKKFLQFSELNFKEGESIEAVLNRLLKKSKKSTKEFNIDKKSDLTIIKNTAKIAGSLFKHLEAYTISRIHAHNLWEEYNSASYAAIFINHLNQWPLNSYTPKKLSIELLELKRQLSDNEELFEKLTLLTLCQKIFKANDYQKDTDISRERCAKIIIKKVESPNKETEEEEVEDTLPAPNYAEFEPVFIGGAAGLTQYISKNVVYPEKSRMYGEQGIVYVKFVVNTDGSIEQVEIRKSPSKNLSKEAIRVIQNMPNWKPGEQAGKNVRVNFTIPIHFRLG